MGIGSGGAYPKQWKHATMQIRDLSAFSGIGAVHTHRSTPLSLQSAVPACPDAIFSLSAAHFFFSFFFLRRRRKRASPDHQVQELSWTLALACVSCPLTSEGVRAALATAPPPIPPPALVAKMAAWARPSEGNDGRARLEATKPPVPCALKSAAARLSALAGAAEGGGHALPRAEGVALRGNASSPSKPTAPPSRGRRRRRCPLRVGAPASSWSRCSALRKPL